MGLGRIYGTKSREEMIEILKEHIIFWIIETIMDGTRHFWSPQCCAGSQESDHSPYKILMKAMEVVMKEQESRYDEDEEYEDE